MIRPFAEPGILLFNLLKKLMERNDDLTTKEIGYIKKLLLVLSVKGKKLVAKTGVQTYQHTLIDQLTKREIDILELLKQRYSNQDISEALFISVETVKSHLKSIYSKLGVGKRKDAVAKAYDRGLF